LLEVVRLTPSGLKAFYFPSRLLHAVRGQGDITAKAGIALAKRLRANDQKHTTLKYSGKTFCSIFFCYLA
jgi:hypothetical protein